MFGQCLITECCSVIATAAERYCLSTLKMTMFNPDLFHAEMSEMSEMSRPAI